MHTYTYKDIHKYKHTPVLSLPPYLVQNWLGEVSANHLCHEGNNQLQTSLSPSIFKVKQEFNMPLLRALPLILALLS